MLKFAFPMRYHLVTYGCQMNTADSDEMSAPLRALGWTASESRWDADLVLFNTCTVRQQAEHRAVSEIGRMRAWKQRKPEALIVVAGCAAERIKDTLPKRFPFVDLIVGAKDIDSFGERVTELLRERLLSTQAIGNRQSAIETNPSSTAHCPLPTAYVNIMRGCNFSCAYCIVPSVRGKEKYLSPERILGEVHAQVANGVKEIMLLGQTVNSYHYQPLTNSSQLKARIEFDDLLRQVNEIQGVERIRFMSPHPRYMTPRVIQAIGECGKVAADFHLPVQSGSNPVLEKMRRFYTREEYLEILKTLRGVKPGLRISTDLIVGFPGETEEDFNQTLSLMDEARFNGVYAFRFSPRPGTEASEWIDEVPQSVKETRLARVLETHERMKRAIHA